MKKLLVLLCAILVVLSLCACNDSAEFDYSDEANNELISMESQKISGDDIGISVVSPAQEDTNKVKVYKLEYIADDFSFEIKDKKVSSFAYLTDEEKVPSYPQKTTLPQYDLEAMREIAVAAYTEKYGELPEGAVVTEPKFTTKNFTGKLVVNYTVYSEPAVDEMQVNCFKKAVKITMTGDLYTWEVQ
ncbi:MAG: hypothetical protein IKL44_06480 [Clostridia bacterium]|nr:hypothetical protein [Clostridia bacterium]